VRVVSQTMTATFFAALAVFAVGIAASPDALAPPDPARPLGHAPPCHDQCVRRVRVRTVHATKARLTEGVWDRADSPDTSTTVTTPAPGYVAGHVTAIGDSVMLDAAPDLTADIPGIDIEAAQSRQWDAGVALAQQLQAEHKLGAIVVIDLGTNGPISVGQFQTMMRVLARASRVVFVTVHLPPSYSWDKSVNAVLEDQVPRYANARIADFNALADKHPGWFGPDRIHMPIGRKGARAMAKLIVSTIKG